VRKTATEQIKKARLKKLISVGLTAILIYVTVSFILTAVVFSVLFKRSDSTLPFLYTYDELSDEMISPREVSFNSDGNLLKGKIYEPDGSKGIIVLANGTRSNSDYHLTKIHRFIGDGWTVATYDATGVGESEGRGIKGLPQIKRDLAAFLAYLRDSGEFNRDTAAFIFGHSAGGYAAACMLSDEYSDEDFGIDGVVSVSGFDRPADVMLYNARKYVGIWADIQYCFVYVYNFILFGKDADTSAYECVNSSDVPVLIINGANDKTVPPSIGLARFDGSFTDPNVTCIEIPDGPRAEHSTAWLSDSSAEYVNGFTDGDMPDKTAANELDESFMSEVLGFFDGIIDN
jgi:pimeloyl-ACP methyl ester carboxylesterase